MSAILGKIIFLIGCLLFGGVIVCGFMACFVTRLQGGIWIDGLGRKLFPTPILVRFIFGEDRFWAGWQWFFADIAWFFGGLALSAKMAWMGIGI